MLLSISLDAPAGPDGPATFASFAQQVKRIAAADPDLVVLARESDAGTLAPGRLEAVVSLPWLAGRLQSALLIAGLPALHSVPFHIARALSAADFLSGGRIGWMPLTAAVDVYDAAYGVAAGTLGQDQEQAKYDDFIRAVQALWDSWDDDALVIDKESGVYLDSRKVRRVAYRGPYFSTLGPLNAARPPQGYPLLLRDVDAVAASQVPADIAIGKQGRFGPTMAVRILKTSASSLETDVAAVGAGAADGLHLSGADGIIRLEALRTRFPRRAVEGSGRMRLGLAKPANPFAAAETL